MTNLFSVKCYRELTGGIWYYTDIQGWVREVNIKRGSNIMIAESYEDLSQIPLREEPISRTYKSNKSK